MKHSISCWFLALSVLHGMLCISAAGQEVHAGTNSTNCTASTLEDLECMLEITPNSFWLHWKVDADAGLVHLAGEAPATGFLGLGWGTNMENSHVVIGSSSATNQALQGVHVYSLTEYTEAGVQPSEAFAIQNQSATESDGRIVVRFSRLDPAGDLSRGDQRMVWSGISGNSRLRWHEGKRAAFTVNLVTLTQSGGEAGNDDLKTFQNVHGALMTLGWGVLIPLGVFSARYLRNSEKFDPWGLQPALWYRLHVSFQVTGLALALIAYIVAIKEFTNNNGGFHGAIGHAVMAIGFVIQPLNGFLRPKLDSQHRRKWEWLHWIVGRVVVFVAILNCFAGLHKYNTYHGKPATRPWATVLFIWMALLLVLSAVMERIEKPYARKVGQPLKSEPAVPDGGL